MGSTCGQEVTTATLTCTLKRSKISLARLLCWYSSFRKWRRPSSHHIHSHHPQLTEALVNIGQCAGSVPSNTVPVASIKDAVLRTTRELSAILDGISGDT